MATFNITITVTTPANMTAATGAQLYSTGLGYAMGALEGETRQAFIKRMLARQAQETIRSVRRREAEQALVLDGEVTVE